MAKTDKFEARIVSKVDVRIVSNSEDQLLADLEVIKKMPRVHVRKWLSSHYRPGQVPRSDPNREAVFVVKAKALDEVDEDS